MAASALDLLARGASSLGVPLDLNRLGAFDELLRLVEAANAGLNLTSLRDAGAIIQRHFLESIALGIRLAERGLLPAGAAVLDLGSGAGFPGLPLKLVWPEISLALLEATAKKARFIEAAVEALGLGSTRVLTGRAETLAHQAGLRESQDIVVARAVAALPALIEMGLPFLRTGGILAAVKGSRAPEEIAASAAALRFCGGVLSGQDLLLPGGDLRLVLIEKRASTPSRYPRRPGQPAAHPLH